MAAPKFSFGLGAAPTATPSTSFSFGAPPATAPASTPAPFSFAPAASTAPSAGFAFGALQQSGWPGASTSTANPTAPASAPAPSLFNPLGSSAPPASLSASSSTPLAATTKQTRFEDLGEGERKALLDLEQFIHARTAIADELKAKTLGEEIKRSYDVLQDIITGLTSLQTSLTQLTRSTWDLRSRVDTDGTDRLTAQRVVDAYSASKQSGPAAAAALATGRSLANFPFEYFSRHIDALTARLRTYHEALTQVQGQVRQQEANQARAILPSLRAQHGFAMSLAAKLAALHQDMTELKEAYTRMWRERVGSVRDPFEDGRTADAQPGMAGLSL